MLSETKQVDPAARGFIQQLPGRLVSIKMVSPIGLP